jgi:hypothetical protein
MQEWSLDGVRQERTGWRDAEISERHRLWGFDCPAVDIDFLMIEYNLGLPIGLVDYKNLHAKRPDPRSKSIQALATLGEVAHLPVMIVRYQPDIWAFRTYPLNEVAKQFFKKGELLTEVEYVRRLYLMRHRTASAHLTQKLNNVLPSGQFGLALPWQDPVF